MERHVDLSSPSVRTEVSDWLMYHACVTAQVQPDIAHPCCDQLTAVKTGHPPVSPNRIAGSGLTHRGRVFLKLSTDKLLVFKRSRAQVYLFKKCLGNTLCEPHYYSATWSLVLVHTTCKLRNQLCNFSIHFGGLFLFHCNYDIRNIHISSKFYSELLQWWSEFRSVFDSRRECQYILRNKKEICVDNKPVFYKKNFLNKMSWSFS